MNTGMPIQIDELRGFARSSDSGLYNGRRRSGKSEDAAVMVGIHGAVQQCYAGNRADAAGDRIHGAFASAFREVGYTLDNSSFQLTFASL
jgi:hypothetical protein